jgi:hypothetical protein
MSDIPAEEVDRKHGGYLAWEYQDSNGNVRARFFQRREEPEWLHYTSWNMKTVPLELLEKMRLVEEMSKEPWDQRGVRVGEAAWRCLTEGMKGN